MIARSWLYVPGDRAELIAKAPRRGADALILDLEDGVAPQAKDDAVETVTSWLTGAGAATLIPVWVRVNPTERLETEVRAVAPHRIAGIVLPKASPEALHALDRLLTELEDSPTGERLPVTALVETARSLRRIDEIAASPRVHHLALGEADLRAELGIEPSEDERELLPIRSAAVVASAAAGIDPPVGSVQVDFRDDEKLRRTTEALKRLGYRGRSAIHPAQLPTINDVFSPTAEEIEQARTTIRRFEEALERGAGVTTDADGTMIDEPIVRAARRVLELADYAGEPPEADEPT